MYSMGEGAGDRAMPLGLYSPAQSTTQSDCVDPQNTGRSALDRSRTTVCTLPVARSTTRMALHIQSHT